MLVSVLYVSELSVAVYIFKVSNCIYTVHVLISCVQVIVFKR